MIIYTTLDEGMEPRLATVAKDEKCNADDGFPMKIGTYIIFGTTSPMIMVNG